MQHQISALASSRPALAKAEIKQKRLSSDRWWPWVFVGPVTVGVLLFYIWPILNTVYLSFTTSKPFGGSEWSGLGNYGALVKDPDLGLALVNTIGYTAIVLLGVPIAIVLASLINLPGLRFANFYRVLFFMPYVAMPVAVALVWRMIYNGNFGLLNWFLSRFGVEGPFWTSTPGFAIIAVGVVGLWSSLGFSMIILGAGLKNISSEVYEAAALDGAGTWRQFRSITVPLLSPSIFFVTIITVIGGFQLFDLLFAMMGEGNPAITQSQSLVYIFYNQAFIYRYQGYASAIAIFILVLIGIVTFVQFRMQRRWVHYV